MTPERFWQLVATLGGRVDDALADQLEDRLADGEAEAFGEAVQQRVDDLLAACEVPPSHGGDTAEWIAAAVVAAGEEVYRRTLAAGGVLDPATWDWHEAEALLVVGHPELDPAPDDEGHWHGETPDLPLTFQWQSERVPPGVRTTWGADTAEVLGALGVAFDPAFGQVPAHDPHLVDVAADLGPAALQRHLVVSEDVEEPRWLLYPEAGDPEHLVLVVPVDLLLEEEDRRPVYAELLAALDAALAELSELPGDSPAS